MAALGVYLQPFGFGVFHVSSCEFTGEHGQSELPVFGSQEAGTQKRFNCHDQVLLQAPSPWEPLTFASGICCLVSTSIVLVVELTAC